MIRTFSRTRFQIIGGAAQRHGSGGTAQFGEGHAPHIRTKTHQVDEMGVERRNHEPGARDGDDKVDVFRPEAGAFQAFLRRFPAQFHGMLDVFVVRFRKRTRLDGVVDGKDGVPLVHLRVVHDAHHGFQAPLGNIEDAPHVILHVVAGDRVRRKRRGCGGNSGRHCVFLQTIRLRKPVAKTP